MSKEPGQSETSDDSRRIEKLDVGVDWITLTCKTSDPNRHKFYQTAQKARDVQTLVTREEVREFNFRGYAGWQVSGLRWGSRHDGEIIMASGASANVYWKLFMRYATNISRVDLQTTAQLIESHPKLLDDYYKYDPPGRRLSKTWVQNNQGGQTLYIGSRSSDQLGRVYDKGIESGAFLKQGILWRYELEFKGERAKAMANNLFVAACRTRDLAAAIQATVFYWFNERGYVPVFRPHPNGVAIQVSLVAEDTDTQRRLAWLKTQVRPSVSDLMNRHARETLEALGLDILLGLVPSEDD